MNKIYYANSKLKRVVTISMSSKIDFKRRSITTDIEENFIIIKG